MPLNISEGNVFIDLRLDYAFALVFGKRGNEDLFLRLIDAILPHLEITSVKLANQGEVGPRPDAARKRQNQARSSTKTFNRARER
ncbi:MAG: hypothetical protein J6O51_05010 [Bacteroidales bacterium]|nr:hypothetical protein [Bacteroidales bacterium]